MSNRSKRNPLGELQYNSNYSNHSNQNQISFQNDNKEYHNASLIDKKDKKRQFSIKQNKNFCDEVKKILQPNTKIQQLRMRYLTQNKQADSKTNNAQKQQDSLILKQAKLKRDNNQIVMQGGSQLLIGIKQVKSNKSSQISSKSNRSSIFRQQFDKKVERVNRNIETQIEKLQRQILLLKQEQNNSCRNNSNNLRADKYQTHQQHKHLQSDDSKFRNISIDNNSKIASNDHIRIDSEEFQDNKINARQIQMQRSPIRQSSEYAKRLKSHNYFQEMKSKIKQIQNQKNMNLSKNLSAIKQSRTQYIESSTNKKPHVLSNNRHSQQSGKQTLANLTPNLAESQIIEFGSQTFRSGCSSKRYHQYEKNDITKFTNEENEKIVFKKTFANNQHDNHNHSSPIIEKQAQQSCCDDELKKSILSSKSRIQNRQKIDNQALQGNFQQKQQEIPEQFTKFVNRIAHQAQLDNRFNQQILKIIGVKTSNGSLLSIVREKVQKLLLKETIFKDYLFDLSQMEIDPLFNPQNTKKDLQIQETNWIALKIKNKYVQMNNYFTKKLQHQFKTQTLTFFIQELQKCHNLKSSDQINVGHLTSYVNMRTGKNFRNRSFYKLFKRICSKQLHSSVNREKIIDVFSQ